MDELENAKKTGEQIINSRPWLYKKGQSGNPSGRPKGISLKEYIKKKFASMTDEEREEYVHGLPKEIIWKMGEGNPDTDITSGGEALRPATPELVAEANAFSEWYKTNKLNSKNTDK